MSEHTVAEQITFKGWIAYLSAIVGAFLAVLNIQVVSASLNDIQGSLGASLDEGSWISTAYLVAEIIVIPLTAWFSRVFSMKWYLLFSSLGFVAFSLLCSQAHDLPTMIVARVFQGLTGGALIPLAFTIMLELFPPAQLPLGMAIFTVTATVAPAIGPTIGGWLTDQYGWPYIFYLNIIPGILMSLGILYAVPRKPLELGQLAKGDWLGIISMAIGMGCLQVVLEEGNRKDWFGSEMITTLTAVAVVFLVLWITTESVVKQPFVNLRLLGRRNFAMAGIINLALGFSLYGAVYIVPVYLMMIQHFNAMQIGNVIMVQGVASILTVPIAAKLMAFLDARVEVGAGILCFAAGSFLNASMSYLSGFDQLVLPQLLRGVGSVLIFVPLTSIATFGIEKEQTGSASALFNMIRNFGGSLGTSTLATLLSVGERIHSSRIIEFVSWSNLNLVQHFQELSVGLAAQGSDSFTAHVQALALVDSTVRREAYVMAFNDCFLLMAVFLLVTGLAVFGCKKIDISQPSAVSH